MGFKEYLIEKRITETAKYLTQTDFSVEEIQSKVGFTDKTRFFKEFSRLYGCTPLEYRKKSKDRIIFNNLPTRDHIDNDFM